MLRASLVLMALLGCAQPRAEEVDANATICLRISKTYWVESPGHRPHHVYEECRLTKYWKVVDGQSVAR